MPYPENFVVRLLVCIVGMTAIMLAVRFVMSTFIFHETYTFQVTQLIVPVVAGIAEAFVWKPKDPQ